MRQIADRKRELEFFEAMLAGKTPERIFLISAPSESGKSVLLSEFAEHAAGVLGVETCARIDLKGALPLDRVLNRICDDLGRGSFPKFSKCGEAAPVNVHAELQKAEFGDENVFNMETHVHQAATPSSDARASSLIADLSVRKNPAVVIVDTYEKATEETSKWIVQQFLPIVRNIPRFWVVIAGQKVPGPDEYRLAWGGGLAKAHELAPVTSAEDWHEYACQRYPNFPRGYIETLCLGLTSRPSAMDEFIQTAGTRTLNSEDPLRL